MRESLQRRSGLFRDMPLSVNQLLSSGSAGFWKAGAAGPGPHRQLSRRLPPSKCSHYILVSSVLITSHALNLQVFAHGILISHARYWPCSKPASTNQNQIKSNIYCSGRQAVYGRYYCTVKQHTIWRHNYLVCITYSRRGKYEYNQNCQKSAGTKI